MGSEKPARKSRLRRRLVDLVHQLDEDHDAFDDLLEVVAAKHDDYQKSRIKLHDRSLLIKAIEEEMEEIQKELRELDEDGD